MTKYGTGRKQKILAKVAKVGGGKHKFGPCPP